MDPKRKHDPQEQNASGHLLEKQCGRRDFLKSTATLAAIGGAALISGCGSKASGSNEVLGLRWNEYFKKNYRLMTRKEKNETVKRLERLAKIRKGVDIQVSSKAPIDQVLFGYEG